MNTLRYAERLKENSDDEEILDKYVSSKAIKATDPLIDDDSIQYESSMIYEKGLKKSEDFEMEYKDPRLYQSHDFSVNTENHIFNNIHSEPVLDTDNTTQYKPQENIDQKQSRRVDYHFENQEFNDSTNLIEYNQGITKTYETDEIVNIDAENSRQYKPGYVQGYSSRPKEYTRPQVKEYVQPVATYDDTERYKKSFEKEYQSYKRMYSAEFDNETTDDQIMQVDSDNSDEHQSPHMYVSNNKESSFKRNISHDNTQNIEHQPSLSQSSSNNRLRYKIDIRSSPVLYNKTKGISSTSSITYNYTRAKNTTNYVVGKNPRLAASKLTYEYVKGPKPLSQTLSYNPKLQTENNSRYDNLSRIVDAKKYNDYFRQDLHSNSKYGQHV